MDRLIMPIKVLDKGLVARIAAGEVVERPASVIKELVENALDAGSSQISVEIRGGGVNLLRVTDNGAGIPPPELELAFERYATSKLGSFEDLESITSLGFRGEALPSIAAVAEVDVVTSTPGEALGAFISLQDGVITARKSQGRSPGTTVTVKNLFRTVPARLKFLKSPATENSHIGNVVSQYALAFPEAKFSLTIDNRVVLRTPGSGQLVDSVAEIYGLEVARNMLTVDTAPDSLPAVTGMAGSPAISRSNRGYLSFFVNHRWITSRVLARAVEEAYHGLLMVGKYPIAVINIQVPPQVVDVNIHPTKTEVKFQQEHVVFSAVQKAVRQALVAQMPVPNINTVSPVQSSTVESPPPLWTLVVTGRTPQHPIAPVTPALSLPVLRVLGQLGSTYIVAEGPEGLYLIDQHAAHERVLFEEIKRQRSQAGVEVQGLLEPISLELDPKQAEVLKSNYPSLVEFGFSLEPFGDRTFLVRAVPALLSDRDWKATLTELCTLMAAGDRDDWTEALSISMACHSAVRAGQTLTDSELRELVRQLEETTVPNTCPHGRPVMICLSSGQLGREFGRSS
ncbi:DNA mismatch repair endonuclease MutL [Chloroflexota bacterium]